MDLLDVADALEYVGDIVDASLLHAQLASCVVDVQNEVLFALDQTNEFPGQQRQRVFAFSIALVLLRVGR